ncbi:MAG: poly(R)-hydroxyalkanoic acid synthase subunit PhaE, partial [Cycloclasticus sp.]|nr:poly(R)-hydroxyalkanoic acid synthase subunit PhaE [Cycloclasticus sp.]
GEKAFKQISQTDDYIQTQLALFDSLSQLKTLQEDTANQLSNMLRLPSQQAIDDLQKGLHQLRTEFAEYRERSEAEIHELSGVINELKSK